MAKTYEELQAENLRKVKQALGLPVDAPTTDTADYVRKKRAENAAAATTQTTNLDTKQQKAKDQREIKKAHEKSKVKRLLPQSLLSIRMKELIEKNRKEFAPDGYQSFLCIEDDEPHDFVSKILGSNFESINGLKSSHFSSLVPTIRFYKVLYNVNGKAKKDRSIKERREITFPTSMSGDLEKRYRSRISFDVSTRTDVSS